MKHYFLLLSALFLLSVLAFAQPGTLDITYGKQGKVLTKADDGYFICNAAALQKDDKVIAAGYYARNFIYQNLLIRYNKDGSIDNSFGINGEVFTDLNFFFSNFQNYAIAITPDGKIVTAGYGGGPDKYYIAITQYKPDGELDSSFGENGISISNFTDLDIDIVTAIAIQSDGRILIAGYIVNVYNDRSLLIACYTSDGKVDDSFGDNGKVIESFGTNYSYATSIAIQQDNKIIIGGGFDTFYEEFLVARYMPDGIIDSSFGTNGWVHTDFGNYDDYINAVAIQKDGKVIAGGLTGRNGTYKNENIALIRYNQDGSIDDAFGNHGKTVSYFQGNNSAIKSIYIQDNKKIVAGGNVYNLKIGDFGITRYSENGMPDSSFGINGQVQTDILGTDNFKKLLIQNDGKIIAAGQSINGNNTYDYNFALTRYFGDPPHPLFTRIKRWIINHILHFAPQSPEERSDIAYYAIEQQTSNGSYKQIGEIPASAGMTSCAGSNYSFALPSNNLSVAGVYRIKAVNKDGSFSYSDAIADNQSNSVSSIIISPNPANDFITIKGLDASKNYTLRIINKEGIVALSVNGQLATANRINVSALKPGIYFLEIKDNEEKVRALKFVKE